VTISPDAESLVRDLAVARLRFEGGQVPDDLDALLDRLEVAGIDKLRNLPVDVRGLLDEGASPATLAMIATSFSLAEVFLRLHHIESGKQRT
jgi:hypothetical protein